MSEAQVTDKGTGNMFGKTIDTARESFSDTIKPYADKLATGLYIIAGLLIMVLLALVTRAN